MSHPLQALRDMVRQASGPTSGTVVSVGAGSAKVRTARGIGAYVTGGFNVRPGQRVAVVNGAVVGVLPSRDSLPVHDV